MICRHCLMRFTYQAYMDLSLFLHLNFIYGAKRHGWRELFGRGVPMETVEGRKLVASIIWK